MLTKFFYGSKKTSGQYMFEFLHRLVSNFRKGGAQAAVRIPGNVQPSTFSVTYDEDGVSLSLEGQVKQEVVWDEIDLIAIRIEDEFLPFPYWYVGNKDNLLCIPNDAAGGAELFFDGFNEHISGYACDATFRMILEASGATEGSFIVWRPKNT